MADHDDDDTGEIFANIRDVLGDFIGCKLIEITQADEAEWNEDGSCYVSLHFDNGATITIDMSDEGSIEVHEPGKDRDDDDDNDDDPPGGPPG